MDTSWYARASSLSPSSFSTFSIPPISLWISFSTAVPCCSPYSTSFCTSANSTSDVSCSSCASCASVFASNDSWYFLRRSASFARAVSPFARHSFAISFSRSVKTVIRFWYWCSLSRWFFMSKMALSKSAMTTAPSKSHMDVLILGGDLPRAVRISHVVDACMAKARPRLGGPEALEPRLARGCSRGTDVVGPCARRSKFWSLTSPSQHLHPGTV